MTHVRRLAETSVCYLLAAFTVAFVVLTLDGLTWRRAPVFISGPDGSLVLLAGTLMAALYAAPLAIPMVVASRFFRAMRWTTFACAGALVGAFIFAVMYATHPRVERPPGFDVLLALAFAGGLAGAVYRPVENRVRKKTGQSA